MASYRKNVLRELIEKIDAGLEYTEPKEFFQKHLGSVDPLLRFRN